MSKGAIFAIVFLMVIAFSILYGAINLIEETARAIP